MTRNDVGMTETFGLKSTTFPIAQLTFDQEGDDHDHDGDHYHHNGHDDHFRFFHIAIGVRYCTTFFLSGFR